MGLREQLESDMKAALKSRESIRLETIRGARGAIRNKEIEVGDGLDDDGIMRVLRTLVKQRMDSVEQFRAACGRRQAGQRNRQAAALGVLGTSPGSGSGPAGPAASSAARSAKLQRPRNFGRRRSRAAARPSCTSWDSKQIACSWASKRS